MLCTMQQLAYRFHEDHRVTFTKFLGVIIGDKLSFSRHVSCIKNKILKGMEIIIKARK